MTPQEIQASIEARLTQEAKDRLDAARKERDALTAENAKLRGLLRERITTAPIPEGVTMAEWMLRWNRRVEIALGDDPSRTAATEEST